MRSRGIMESRTRLTADCSRCVGLCCVVPAFAASADFAIDKPAATPCPNLREDFRCTIHAELGQRGFRGCVAYDCFGAGQRVTQATFAGSTWRTPSAAAPMFAAFETVRALHELLWYVAAALELPAVRSAPSLVSQLEATFSQTDSLAGGTAAELSALDVGAHR